MAGSAYVLRMGTQNDRWRGVLPVWTGILVAGGAAVVVEVLLLDEALAMAIGVTVAVGLAVGVVVTRRLLARNDQPMITVMDLRRR